jgi:GAF domain-containing protein
LADRYDSYFAGLYLLDDNGQTLDLIDATGEAGQVLKESGHHLELSQKNPVSLAIRENKIRILKTVSGVTPSVDNPLLPYTRSELCLPLYVGERAIGVIDIHSAKDSIFLETELPNFEELAALLSNAIANARSFDNAQEEIKDLSSAQQRYIQTSWAALSSSKPIEFRLGDENVATDANEFKVPLALRDQIIGQISLTTESEWTPEQKAMIETIATQAALALENARLVEESQASATHDRIAVDITSKVWSTSSMDGILQTAVRELGRALGASEATIELVEGVKNEL